MVNFDKFLASFITEIKKYSPITSYNIPGCIKKALKDQGFEYKDGEVVRISDESEDERIRKSLIDGFKRYDDGALFNGCLVREILPWLEKQGNPNTEYWKGYKDGKKAILDRYSETHKIVEPKFNIGNWIVSDLDDVNEDFRLCKIIDIKDGCYTIQSANGGKGYNFFEIWESDYHLWSIEDAKDGDVLAVNSMPFIYNGSKNEVTVGAYCGFNAKHRFSFAYNYVINQNITPAAKAQYDTLMKAITEAGYTFDFEKKELKKIDNEEVNGEDYGIDGLWHAQRILEKTLGEVDGYQTNDGILDHKAAITAVKKLYEQKPAWSEEDERIYQSIIDDTVQENQLDSKQIDWLKFLKQRYTWKPSKEQMDAMQLAVSCFNCKWTSEVFALLKSLYEDLKKLKG